MRLSASIAFSNWRLINYWVQTINGEAHTHIVTSKSTFSVAGTVVENEVLVA